MTLTHAERHVPPLVYPPPGRADLDAITEAENRRDAETKTALSRLALGQLRIEGLLRELIAETRARREQGYRILPMPRWPPKLPPAPPQPPAQPVDPVERAILPDGIPAGWTQPERTG